MIWRRARLGRRAAIPFGPLRREGDRVICAVDGEDVWWSSQDVSLGERPEALVATMLLPALRAARPLHVTGQLDDRFVDGVGRVMALAREWWGYRPVGLVDDRGKVRLDTGSAEPTTGNGSASDRAAVLAFTGGVDSFYSLLEHGKGLSGLVFVRGFDLRHWFDAAILDGAEDKVRVVAAELGLRPYVIETNLRDHHLIHDVDWPMIHGGAIAGVGHLLTDTVDALWISAAYAVSRQHVPYGTHARLDPLWTSGRLAVRHVGDDCIREEKVAAIGSHPLVTEHLRVCWANPTPEGNCGRCEKCLRTRIALLRQHPDVRFPCFPPSDTLVADLDALERIDPDRRRTLDLMSGPPTPPEVVSAIRSLVDRSVDVVP
jgi:hypothetical protein